MTLRTDYKQSAQLRNALAEFDVRAAPRHVRRDRHRISLPRVRHDLRLFFMEFRIENAVRNAALFEDRAQFFRLRDRCRSDQYRLPLAVNFFDRIAHRAIFRALRLVNYVRMIRPNHRHVCRYHDHRQFVDLQKFVFFGFRRACHSRQFVIHSEVILKRDRRQRLRFALNAHAFLRLDRLMQAVRVSPPFHQSSGELVDNHDLVTPHHVIPIAFHQRLRA